jgi:putative transposase
MNRDPAQTGEIYHVYNRGVDKRKTFMKNGDYTYFIHHLFVLNDSLNRLNISRDYRQSSSNRHDGGSTSINNLHEREQLVDILAFCLMPNHYHLLLKQKVDDGIAKFMHKLGTGYTMFFNEKYKRSGALFQGRYKMVHVESDRQLLYLPHYIHLNPVPHICKETTSPRTCVNKLTSYRWSSYRDYAGLPNYSSVTSRDYVLNIFGGSKKYEKDLFKFLVRKKIDLKQNTETDPHLLIDSK